nr:PREDICTED: uncharacterized protein LOC109034571 [Bemisia tabaci]
MCSIPAATNHYTCTNLDEPYNPVSEVSEAVYAELDRVPTPAYQNTSYLDSCDAAADPGVPTTATLPNNHNHNFYTDIIPVHYEQVNNYNGAVYSRGNHAVPSDYI